MAYQPLTPETLLDYLKGRPALAEILPPDETYDVQEVGDGNLNLVFVVQSRENPAHTLVVKQALPYLRVVGEDWPLTRDRVIYETEALMLHNKYAPGLAPRVYDHDYEMSTLMMENLNRHEIMRKPLVRRVKFPKFAEQIATFLANTLFYTSDLYLKGEEKKALVERFMNPHLRKLQEDFVYTNPFKESPENNWNPLLDDLVQEVRRDGDLKERVAWLKEGYMNHAQSLIHADLHTGSIMINQQETRVIDPEFAFVGPAGYDVAAVLQNLMLSYASHFAHTPDPAARADYQGWLLETMKQIWERFAEKFENLWIEHPEGDLMPADYWAYPGGEADFARFRKDYLATVFRDMVGIAGTKALRRMMGIVSVWDISSIEDPEKRALAERFAIQVGRRWIKEMDAIKNVDQFLDVMREEAERVDA
ncbi:S-methyl-5-thioribose kinase [Oceanithermus sp.]|uniref:S-methyl-5-thioribose kinase n=1 Tax=Oceanithermus sp. TaxID=2268145 RepID=UPI00257FD549|nr:S-methyl-5-thioribose kinase [Oceanithermus sp.]